MTVADDKAFTLVRGDDFQQEWHRTSGVRVYTGPVVVEVREGRTADIAETGRLVGSSHVTTGFEIDTTGTNLNAGVFKIKFPSEKLPAGYYWIAAKTVVDGVIKTFFSHRLIVTGRVVHYG